MPSFLSNLVKGQIALMNPLLQRLDVKKSRDLQEGLGRLQQRAVGERVRFEDVPFDHFEASWALPEKGSTTHALLYLHGGAYTAGEIDYSRGFGGAIADQTERAVLCVAYRLAPDHSFPAALDDAAAAYHKMLETFPAENIAFLGESAGGGLCYTLALKCKQENWPLPSSIITISPWCDLTMERERAEDLKCRDVLLSCEGLMFSAKAYAGETPLTDPLISPLFGDLTGLPPSLMFVGADEILQDDAVLMAEKLNAHGSPCVLQIAEGMWHAYVLYGMPESKEAIAQIKGFLMRDAIDA